MPRFLFLSVVLLMTLSCCLAYDTPEEAAAWAAYEAVSASIGFSPISDLQRRSGCTTNGVSGGTCQTVASIGSQSFCGTLLAQYKTGSACVSSEGATAMDTNAFQLYNTYYKGLYQNALCQAAFTDYICSVQFNQCSGSTSVGLCASTCSSYFKWCANKEVACDANTIPNTIIVPKSEGPSDTCTGAAGSLIPSTIFALVTMVFISVFFTRI